MRIISMKMGSSDDASCNQAFLEVDGVKYCTGNNPQEVNIPRFSSGQVVLRWQWDAHCDVQVENDCGINIIISEAGEPTSYSTSSVGFEAVNKYTDANQGILSTTFKIFFLVVI